MDAISDYFRLDKVDLGINLQILTVLPTDLYCLNFTDPSGLVRTSAPCIHSLFAVSYRIIVNCMPVGMSRQVAWYQSGVTKLLAIEMGSSPVP